MGFSCDLDNKKRGGGITTSLFNVGENLIKKIPIGAVVNTAIDALPVELHLPGGYQYCGPGTKLEKRLKRGDPGINKLDQACKEHDIAYSKYSDVAHRTTADRNLAKKAWDRVKSVDSSLGKRASALAVTAAMKAKTAFGGGVKRKSKKKPAIKRGGRIKNKKNSRKKRCTKTKQSLWSMIKSGRGLYLRPYQRV